MKNAWKIKENFEWLVKYFKRYHETERLESRWVWVIPKFVELEDPSGSINTMINKETTYAHKVNSSTIVHRSKLTIYIYTL